MQRRDFFRAFAALATARPSFSGVFAAEVESVITASHGQIEIPSAGPLEAVGGYRAMFDLRPTDDSVAPIDLCLYLRTNGQPLTETWLYQWTPPDRLTW